ACFFARRAQSNNNRASRETAQDCQRRQQREAHAAHGGVPGNKGARVYVWEKSNGHYVRRAAGRGSYEEVWDDHGPLQRRFDSFHNEWDVCEAFGPDGGDDDEGDDGNDAGYDSAFAGAPFAETEEEDDDVPTQILPEEEDSLEEGQLPLAVPSSRPVMSDSDSTPELASIALSFLGDAGFPVKNQTEMQHFRAFVAYCRKAKALYEIPRNLLDFHDTDSDLYTPWAIRLRRETLNKKLYYIVSDPDSHLYVLLESATTALEIVRQGWGPSLTEVIESLLARGIQFLVCSRSKKLPSTKLPSRNLYSGLGYRPQNYIPDAHDYKSYVGIRNQFLLSPRGRAAVLHGGVVGRLARAVVSIDDVLRGPTDDADIDGICLWDGHSQSAYWDDYLTEQEINLICGVYHISTGITFPLNS
ncbi:hypothetical protein B0H13DRAFT_1653562, partial [Mycena leptocephala]